MQWGIFSLSQIPDQSRRVQAFEEDMKFFELAENLGYDTIWIAEHLFSNYGVVTSCQVYAAAIAERVKRIKIGMAVVVLPFNHPLRTAADFALVDVLSHGRLKFGAGRAYQPHEFLGLGVPMEQSREMYQEALDIILKAWTQEKITHDGKFWKIPEPVEVLPKPVQKPYPPLYQACVSPDSFETAAANGASLQMAAPFSYRTYRENWIEELAKLVQKYERACEKAGRDPKAAERMFLIPFYCEPEDAKAKSRFAKHVEWFYSKVTQNQLAMKGDPGLVRGYEQVMAEGKKTREMGYLSFEKLHQYGACIAAAPTRAAEQLNHLRERLGITEFVLWSSIGGLEAPAVEDCMRRTMTDVVPLVGKAKARAAE